MNKRTQTGFTLYELLTTLLIVGVILTIGVPNLREFRQNARMTSTANDLHAAFHLARTEATRAKENITICASANSMDDPGADCGGTWDQGYIVFVDTDGNIATGGVNESILRRHPEIQQGVSLAVANDATYFSYSGSGLGRGIVNGQPSVTQVVMCDKRGNVRAAGGNSASRLFVATPLGRVTIQRDLDMIDAALIAMGKACPP